MCVCMLGKREPLSGNLWNDANWLLHFHLAADSTQLWVNSAVVSMKAWPQSPGVSAVQLCHCKQKARAQSLVFLQLNSAFVSRKLSPKEALVFPKFSCTIVSRELGLKALVFLQVNSAFVSRELCPKGRCFYNSISWVLDSPHQLLYTVNFS